MTEKTISSQTNNIICDAFGCSARATTKITIKVGNQGAILLQVCNECIKKFGDN